jgi:hypothetical protein
MGGVELVGLAASVSLLSGWRVYLCTFCTGLAMRIGWIALPDHLAGLDVLANPWILGISGFGLIAEFLADKVAWIDTIWDAVHTIIRPAGGALLALAIVDAQDPVWQLASLLLGGSAALLSHGAKMGTRAVVNASPEPFSNIAVSSGEDLATSGLLLLVFTNPIAAIAIAALLLLATIAMILLLRRILRRLLPARS